jgi:hypothetical protein
VLEVTMRNLASLVVVPALAASAIAAINPPGGITSTLTASADEEPAFMLRAQGVHVFECKPLAADPTRFAWTFSAPDVTLYDAGRPVARNAAENMFEALADRSTVTGAIRSRQDGGANNLPWLLLRAQSTPDDGLFAGVTSVQRVNTSGGVAPDSGCDVDNAGKEARAALTADYYFYRRRG